MRVGYAFLRGTNIEVAVRRVGAGGRFAIIALRHGKHKNMKYNPKTKKRIASRHVEITVPCYCLTLKSSFTARGCLKKNFKPLGSETLDLQKPLFIWGLPRMHLPVRCIKDGVVTFASIPVRKAHVSVIRNGVTLLEPVFEKRRHEVGFLAGTDIAVKLCIEDSVSLYRVASTYEWIESKFAVSKPPTLPVVTPEKRLQLGLCTVWNTRRGI